MDGIIVVDKSKDFTSHDVVAKLRGILHQKKIGHTGTLDPDATGVLPILLGKATKLSDMLTADDKTYEATFVLGIKTDTQDVSGEIIEEKEITSSEEEILSVIKSFIGEIDQVPPMYSAIKVDGKKLYELAREGKEVERKSRRITIHNIDEIEINGAEVSITVYCSKGTYIRTLCHDIGEKLGCGAALKELRRTKSGNFEIEDAFTLDEIQKMADAMEMDDKVLPIEKALEDHPAFTVDARYDKALYNGNILDPSYGEGETSAEGTRVYSATGELIGLYIIDKNGMLKPHKMFL